MTGIREDWFPTSIWYFDLEDAAAINEQLLPAIRAEREQDPQGMTDRTSVLALSTEPNDDTGSGNDESLPDPFRWELSPT